MTCGQDPILFANAFALCLAEGATDEELNVLGAFFTVLGDQLSLLAACNVKRKAKNENTARDERTGAAGTTLI